MPSDLREVPSSGDPAGALDPPAPGGRVPSGVLSILPDPWIRYSRTGVYLDLGGPTERLAMDPATLRGRNVRDVLAPEAAARLLQGIDDALCDRPVVTLLSIETPAGILTFEVTISRDGDDEVVAFIHDVTARIAAERRVAASEQRFRAVVGLTVEGIWIVDVDGVTTFATERMAAMVGRSPAEMVGRPMLDFIDQGSLGLARERLARRRLGETETGPLTLRHAAGGTLDVIAAATPLLDDDGAYVGAVAVVSDDTEAKRLERELAESQRVLGAVAAVHDDVHYTGEILADGTYHEVFTGPGSGRLLGRVVDDATEIGPLWNAAVHADDREAYDALNARVAGGMDGDLEYRLVGGDGVTRWVHDRVRPRSGGASGLRVFDGVVGDITRRREQADELARAMDDLTRANVALEHAHAVAAQQARTDPLTGAYNRRHFLEVLAEESAHGTSPHGARGILLIDVDHFKRINDEHGHDAGDRVLVEVATRLARATRRTDVVARWGGEEFIVLVPDVPDVRVLARIGESLLQAIRETPIACSAGEITATVSVGAAWGEGTQTDLTSLIEHADRALYTAKRRGRDRYAEAGDLTELDAVVAEEPGTVQLAEGLAIAASLREGVSPAHAGEVAGLAALIARELELSDAMVLRCRLAGWLHDIGKLELRDETLQAGVAGRSGADVALRRHAEIGADIIEALPTLRAAAAGVRHHHERFDGTGYPDGLAGDAIPLEARIVAAAEACATRTLAELAGDAGSSLDPAIVDALVRVVGAATRS